MDNNLNTGFAGKNALHAMQNLETNSVTFRKPKVPQKKRKQKILSEDHYVQVWQIVIIFNKMNQFNRCDFLLGIG